MKPLQTTYPLTRCDELASSQHGVISRGQALNYGVTRHGIQGLLETRRWIRVLPGVYRLAGAPETWRQRLVASLLWAGKEAAISDTSAAALLRLDGFHPGTVEISVTRALKSPMPWLVVHHVKAFGEADVMKLDGIRVTTPARIVVDLAGRLEQSALLDLVDDCLRRRFFSVTRLRWQVRQIRSKPGLRSLKKILENPVVPDSVLERRLLSLIRLGGLPKPELQHVIRDGKVFLARVDFCYPDRRVVIEADGKWFHYGDSAFEKDRPRRNALESFGWRVLHFTWRDLIERPEMVVATLARALAD
jgi:very-short-patch-repair endonuclease